MKPHIQTQETNDRLSTREINVAKHVSLAPVLLAFMALLSTPTQSFANDLKEQTLTAWDGYIRWACLRADVRAKQTPFLRISEPPERRQRVQAGEIVVWRESEDRPTMPHGLVHSWMGAVFIPRATIAD